MPYLIVFAAIALAVIAGASAVVFVLLRRRGLIPALLTAALTVTILIALWPIPTHGGFTFLFEIALHELHQTRDLVAERLDARQDERFWQRQSDRFGRTLAVVAARDAGGGWQEVEVGGGIHAWLDTTTGLLWTDVVEVRLATSMPPLADSQALCGRLPPAGAWALPSEGDQYSFWRSAGHTRLPGQTASQLSYLVDPDLRAETPVYSLRGGANQAGAAPTRNFKVRCLARTAAAPQHGYAREKIPLEEWNRFQLAKLAPTR